MGPYPCGSLGPCLAISQRDQICFGSGHIPHYVLDKNGDWCALTPPYNNLGPTPYGFWQEYDAMGLKVGVRDATARVLARRAFLLDSFYLLQTQEGTWLQHYNIPLFALEQIGHAEKLQARWLQLRSLGVDPHPYVLAVVKLSDETWNAACARIASDAAFAKVLEALIHPAAAEYFLMHPEFSADHILKASWIIRYYYLKQGQKDHSKFLNRIQRFLAKNNISVTELHEQLENNEKSELITTLEHFLTSDEVEVSTETQIAALSSQAHPLSDAITHLKSKKLEERSLDFLEIPKSGYGCEYDVRSLVAATQHLYVKQPYAWLRELLQNSLDALRGTPSDSSRPWRERVAEGRERGLIQAQIYKVNNEAILSFYDEVGMEEEAMNLLLPGVTTKLLGEDLGGFGVGFKAILSGANWVRVKTAKSKRGKLSFLDFQVQRDAEGEIIEIQVRTAVLENDESFKGTLVETSRYTNDAELEMARLKAHLQHVGKYISLEYRVMLGEEQVNAEAVPTLTNLEDDPKKGGIGRVEVMDAFDFKILLGDLPMCNMPQDLLEAVPEGIWEFFRRKGWCLRLDPKLHLPIETRDRLQNHEAVMARLKQLLPGLIIKAFLTRVAQKMDGADLHLLPQEYFVQSYDLEKKARFDAEVLRHARLINAHQMESITDYSIYSRAEEQEKNLADRKLTQLLTLVEFIEFEWRGKQKISVQDIYEMQRDPNEKANLQRLKESGRLPDSLRSRLARDDRSQAMATKNENLLEESIAKQDDALNFGIENLQKNQKYFLDKIHDTDTEAYLLVLQEMTAAYYQYYNRGKEVKVGIHTFDASKTSSGLASYARHYVDGNGDYCLLRSFGVSLKEDIEAWAAIRSEENIARKKRMLLAFLIRHFETLSHEVTHVEKEGRRQHFDDSFTHDKKFFHHQIGLLFETLSAWAGVAREMAA
ncbi:MAG: hypothetical protein HQM15_01335 [Deltaproteobacteria bacterium]|nr:hypothetical protein [Deltaproteobacteria bacterium]